MNIPDREQARKQMVARDADLGTICAEHRKIWASVQGMPDAERAVVEEQIITAYIMAKKMANRLSQYDAQRRELGLPRIP